MSNEVTIQEISEILLRFLSRPRSYYGTLTIKYQNGLIKNVLANDSFDMAYLSEKKLNIEDNKMFTKFGAPTKENKESSKILTEVVIDEDKNIVKESKIKKEDAEDKKD